MCAFGEKSEALRWSMEAFTAKQAPAGQQDRDISAPGSCFSPLHSQLFGSTSKERHGWRRGPPAGGRGGRGGDGGRGTGTGTGRGRWTRDGTGPGQEGRDGLTDPLFTSQREQGSLPRAFLCRMVERREGGGKAGGGAEEGTNSHVFSFIFSGALSLCTCGVLVCLPACPREWHELEPVLSSRALSPDCV